MLQGEGEGRVRALQKEFLCWVEAHSELYELPPEEFNYIRKRVFRATFDAFRLGRIGIRDSTDAANGIALWLKFVEWGTIPEISPTSRLELQAKCFTVSLLAFRAGAMVAGGEL